jgi:hypothetical protein
VPIRPLQLYADGGYQLRIRRLEGTPNYGPRQLSSHVIGAQAPMPSVLAVALASTSNTLPYCNTLNLGV